ncbi:MAG: zinc-ribbon domain-containing protein, partial [Zoogloeaceae bacterium]|nr:zinc-ribbon domain-containing protein [Zoogloeaceae bacterium]
MLTRCPHCRTAFRVTREQLLARDGKVRCGACRRAFNAMGYLDQETGRKTPETEPPAAIASDTPPEETSFLETLIFPEENSVSEEDDFFAGWPP